MGLVSGFAVGGVGCFRLAWLCAGLVSLAPCSPVAAVAAGAQNLSQLVATPSQLAGLHFVARAPLTCGQADALPWRRFRGKVKTGQQDQKRKRRASAGFRATRPGREDLRFELDQARAPCHQRRLSEEKKESEKEKVGAGDTAPNGPIPGKRSNRLYSDVGRPNQTCCSRT